MTKERNELNTQSGSRWKWATRCFSLLEVRQGKHTDWIMDYVKISPYTTKVFLRDGEVVRHTSRPEGGLDVEIRYENQN